MRDLLVLCHRGVPAWPGGPENTHAAFARAVRRGADGIETDVRITGDGQLVTCHDRGLPDGRRLADVTRSELERALGHEVPTVEEALERWDVIWNLELKAHATVASLVPVVRRWSPRRRIVITSSNLDALAESAAALDVEHGLVLSSGHLRGSALEAVCAARPGLGILVWPFGAIDVAFVAASRPRGIRHWVYAVSTTAQHAHCASLGFEAVITD